MQRGAFSTVHGAHVMFESFRKFLSDVSEGEKRPPHFEHDDYRLAAAALLVHAAAIDGTVSDVERRSCTRSSSGNSASTRKPPTS
jgi:uncharacterized tellurite resistance protein B-like protein